MYQSSSEMPSQSCSATSCSRLLFLVRAALLLIVSTVAACGGGGGGSSDGDSPGSGSSSSSGGSSGSGSSGGGEPPPLDLKFIYAEALPAGDAANPKLLQLAWELSGEDVARVTEFAVEYNPNGSSGFHLVIDGLDKGVQATELELAMHLVQWDSARYRIMAADREGRELAGSQEIPISAIAQENMVGYIKAMGQSGEDLFGEHLVLSGDGKTLAVSAPTKETPDGMASGIVHIFRKEVGGWIEEAALTVENRALATREHNFGFRLAMADDGNKLAVFSAIGTSLRQPIHIFSREAEGWKLSGETVTLENCVNHKTIGVSLAISPDGANLALGCPFTNHVETFHLPEEGGIEPWKRQPIFFDLSFQPDDRFGMSVSISNEYKELPEGADGGLASIFLAIGAPGRSYQAEDDTVLNAGAVFVNSYQRPWPDCLDCAGEDHGGWQFAVKAEAPNPSKDAYFGHDIDYLDNGDYPILAIGSPGSNSGRGAAYVFPTKAYMVFDIKEEILPISTELQKFGHKVRLSSDGQVLAVSAPGNSSGVSGIGNEAYDTGAPGSGAVYVYTKNNDHWQFRNLVKAPHVEGDMEFGKSIGLSNEGDTLAIGASKTGMCKNAEEENDNSCGGNGAVFVY